MLSFMKEKIILCVLYIIIYLVNQIDNCLNHSRLLPPGFTPLNSYVISNSPCIHSILRGAQLSL
jgi:hypothetical protein